MKIYKAVNGPLVQGYDCLPNLVDFYFKAGLAKGLHGGYDYSCKIGTPIFWNCDLDGEVNYNEVDGNGGKGCAVVVVDSENKRAFKFRFWHLSKFGSVVGEIVKKGTVIGWSGNTGKSTGPHLHFDVKELKVSPTGKYAALGDYYDQMYPSNGAFGAIRIEEWLEDKFVLDTLSLGDKTNRLLILLMKNQQYK